MAKLLVVCAFLLVALVLADGMFDISRSSSLNLSPRTSSSLDDGGPVVSRKRYLKLVDTKQREALKLRKKYEEREMEFKNKTLKLQKDNLELRDKLQNTTLENQILSGDLFVKAYELGRSLRNITRGENLLPKHRRKPYLQRLLDAVPADSTVYHPTRLDSRANIERHKESISQDIFEIQGNGAPLAHLVAHSFTCRSYLVGRVIFICGCDENNKR